jgi:hypothetical protein
VSDGRVSLRSQFSGPFFKGDARRKVRANMRRAMEHVAERGASAARGEMAAAMATMKEPTGWTLAHILGRTSSLRGKAWQVSAVVSVNTFGMSRKDAIRLRASGASIERRYRVFRKVTNAIKRERKRVAEEVLKGLQ